MIQRLTVVLLGEGIGRGRGRGVAASVGVREEDTPAGLNSAVLGVSCSGKKRLRTRMTWWFYSTAQVASGKLMATVAVDETPGKTLL
jgi:hypothetical protein